MRFFRNAIIFMFIFNHTHFMMHSKKLWRHKNNVVFFFVQPSFEMFFIYSNLCNNNEIFDAKCSFHDFAFDDVVQFYGAMEC